MGLLTKRFLQVMAAAVLIYVVGMFLLINVSIRDRPLIYRSGDYYNLPGGSSWQGFHEFDPATRWDAIIIGSSHAYRGYDPAVFGEMGHRVFNLGTNAQTPLNSYYVIKHYLDSTNCGLLIFDVYEGTLQSTGLESTADLTQNLNSDAAALGMAWALEDLRGLNMMALRLISRPTEPSYTDPEYVGLGFTVKHDSIGTGAGYPSDTPVELLERQRHYLEACIQLCRERGIPMVITSHYARRNKRGEAHKVLAQYMDSILTRTGVPYLDYTNTPGIEDRYWFFDETHLNSTGAKIFSGELVDSLEALGYFGRSGPR